MTEDRILLLALICLGLLVFAAIPVLIAIARRNPDTKTIAKLAPLALLSFALWFALIAWAATDRRNDGVISQFIDRVQGSNLGPWLIALLLVIGLGGTALTLLL